MKTFYWLACSILLASPIALLNAEQRIPGEELQALFSNSTQIGTTTRGSSGPQTYWLYKRADGSAAFRLQDGWTDAGSWWINEEGKSCTRFEKMRKGKERCSVIMRLGDSYQAVRPDGTTRTLDVVPGNPEGL